MFEEYSPLKNQMLKIMDDEGKIINPKWMLEIPDLELLAAFKHMLFARTVDLMQSRFNARAGCLHIHQILDRKEYLSVSQWLFAKKTGWCPHIVSLVCG